MSDISDLPKRIKRTIFSTYIGQVFCVGLFAVAMLTGYRAYLLAKPWLLAWNVFIFAINVGLFLLQGHTREKLRMLLAQVEEALKAQRPPSPE